MIYLVQRKGELILRINKKISEAVTYSDISSDHIGNGCEVLIKGVSDDMMVWNGPTINIYWL